MGYDKAELSVLITDDEEIQALNSTYRNRNSATDVLSFPSREGEGTEFTGEHLGDIAISLETALRQAEELEVSGEEELFRLLIHGLLHLLGYDHENVEPEVAEQMWAKEEELTKLLEDLE